MTPHEKAVNALNQRLSRLQAALGNAKDETAQRFAFQSIVVTLGVAEALNDYLTCIGEYARRRHAEVKQSHEALGAQHTELLKTGQDLLAKLKASPTDQALRKEIARTQQAMETVQKNVRRGTNALQRELAPSVATIDRMTDTIRRLAEIEETDVLKRFLKATVAQVRELYATQSTLPAKHLVDADAWEEAALAELDQSAGFLDAYARTGYHATLALAWMKLAVSENPPQTTAEATQRANEAAAARLKEISGRLIAEGRG